MRKKYTQLNEFAQIACETAEMMVALVMTPSRGRNDGSTDLIWREKEPSDGALICRMNLVHTGIAVTHDAD